MATAHAAVQAGLVPWFIDVDPDTWMLDPSYLATLMKDAPGPVAAAVPVAAFGRLPELSAWTAFREHTGVPVVLDAAAAFDALDKAPIPAIVSLHATKALGVGEGGFVASEDAGLIDRVRLLTNFGFQGSREAQVAATNAKLSEYAAAIGQASLDGWPAARLRYMRTAQYLRIALIGAPEIGFQPGWGVDWISSVCVVRLPDGAAGRVEARLKAQGVATRHWWEAGCHHSPAFADALFTSLPNTERLAGSTLGLPFAIDMSEPDIRYVADALLAALALG